MELLRARHARRHGRHGRIIPAEDIPVLTQLGVRGVFGPGTNTQDIVAFIQKEQAAA
jgi:methylmalonyl-CoA mutase cobalamin-binding domain/chain